MTTRNLALFAPFLVLAVAVASLTATPLVIQKRAEHLGEPALRALAISVAAIDHLVDMRTQLHRYAISVGPGKAEEAAAARQRLDASFASYGSDAVPGAYPLVAALSAMERAIDMPGADSAEVRKSSERLTKLLMSTLASETQRARLAANRLEQVRAESLRVVNRLDTIWVAVATLGGAIAALLVRRQQRFAVHLHRLEQERASELEQFSARLAHDIVSPLAPVALGVEVLARKLDGDPQAQEAAAAIRRSLDRVGIIVDELFRFAQTGGHPEPGEQADIARVMHALDEELAPAAEQKSIAITFEPPPSVKVACAEGALLVVLQNLVRNAIKYTGDGPRKRIVARATVLADKVRLMVHDSGPGIPAGMEKTIFDPYVRANRREAGIGLGLATVKRIVESRSGEVGVTSNQRTGTTFWVELPMISAR